MSVSRTQVTFTEKLSILFIDYIRYLGTEFLPEFWAKNNKFISFILEENQVERALL